MKPLNAYCHSLIKQKLQGAALLSTLIMAIVLLSLCTGILLLLYYSKAFHSDANIAQRLKEDVYSGTQLILSASATSGSDSLNLSGNEKSKDSVYFRTIPWGCFYAAAVRAKYKNREQDRFFLYGASKGQYTNATLYLTDFNRPLSLIGETYINGKVYLPKSGVRAGFLNQQGFTKDKLVDGTIDTSEKQLPPLNPAFKAYVQKLMLYSLDISYPYHSISADAFSNSFKGEVLMIKEKGNLILNNKNLVGKIIIVSDSSIEVTPTNYLQDVLLVAPYIKFDGGFSGSVQAFAADSITVGESCRFKYPSALVVTGRSGSETGSLITIRGQSQIEGCLIACSGKNTPATRPVIKLDKDATLNGLLYCEGYTTLEGKVAGSVFTDFFLQTNQSLTMENTLLNASITESKWSQLGNYYSVFSVSNQQKIVRWLR